MEREQRFLLFLAVTGLLAVVWFVVPVATGLSRESITPFVALAELAAAVVALLPESAHGLGGQCKAYDVYFLVLSGWPLRFNFDAKLVNAGNRPDVAERVMFAFYDGLHLLEKGTFVAGARELTKPTGQVLPCPLPPGTTFLVEAKYTNDMKPAEVDRLLASRPDFYLRCRFVFAHSRPKILRVRHGDPGQLTGFANLLRALVEPIRELV